MVNKRDKESDRDASESKKHRKTNASSVPEIQSLKLAKVDVYAVSIENVNFIESST